MKLNKIENSHIGEVMYVGEHKNGLGVFVIPKKDFVKKYAIFGTRYGSIDSKFIPKGEKEPVTVPDGIAHFLEHKMFEQPDGTNAFDKFAKYGANANAFTSFNCTCYLFSCTDNFNENFEHLMTYVQEPYFTKENVEKEQGIIGQEIRMYDDDPDWQVQFNLLKALYKDHPVKIDIAGTVESISKIDDEVLYKCYNTFYDPSNMAVCVVGDVDADEIGEIIEKTVTKDGAGAGAVSIYPEEPKGAYKSEIRSKLDVAIPLFNLGYKDNDNLKGDELLKNEIAMKILVKLIAGRSSELYNDMYEEGLINANFATDIMCEPQFSCVVFGGESEKPMEVCKRIEEAVEKLKKDGINEKDFQRVRKAVLGGFSRGFNDVESIGTMVLRNILNGINIFNFHNVFETVDAKYVEKRLNDVFTKENMAVSIVE